jgi:CyaY protein
MSDTDFETLAQAAMEQLRKTLESDPELDVEEKGDGVIEISFDDGSKIIVNRHSAAREIWVAARSGGFHFRWDGGAWRSIRDGSELFEALEALIAKGRGA